MTIWTRGRRPASCLHRKAGQAAAASDQAWQKPQGMCSQAGRGGAEKNGGSWGLNLIQEWKS